MSTPLNLMRPDLRDFTLYTPADGDAGAIRLHANELPWRPDEDYGQRGLNRYPEPRPTKLRRRLAKRYAIGEQNLLLTRGSDDGIDLIVRTFCRAGRDRVLIVEPCFAMYAACARLQGCRVDQIELDRDRDFALDAQIVLDALSAETKLVFLCSPNNPTGSVVDAATIDALCRELATRALLVVDEAYAEFSSAPSALALLERHANLVVLRTTSKAYGLAGLRLGSVIAGSDIIAVLSRLMTPYPLPSACVDIALAATATQRVTELESHWQTIVDERRRLGVRLERLPEIVRVWPSAGNFILAQFKNAKRAASAARRGGFLLRALGGSLADCLRITVGSPDENRRLLDVLAKLRS